jgi:hypothetical protein
MRQVAGQAAEVAFGFGREDSLNALVELLKREPSVREVLSQFGGDGVAFGVPDAQTRLRCHLPLRAVRKLIPKRYIATTPAATGARNSREQGRLGADCCYHQHGAISVGEARVGAVQRGSSGKADGVPKIHSTNMCA